MIAVIGLGFVGLTTGLGFSNKGYKVYGFDIDRDRLTSIENSKVPFHEPFLKNAIRKNINQRFFIAKDIKEAVDNSRIIFYCVGTPCNKDGSADLKYLLRSICDTLKCVEKGDFKLLVIKSTIPPSTTEKVLRPYIENLGFKIGHDIGLANNPEFLREGHAWEDFIKPDRIVIGCADKKSGAILERLYRPFNAPVLKFSMNTAEFIKYLSNTLLANLISFSNEMSMIADTIGNIDIKSSFKALHLDKRWYGRPAQMTTYVYPGCGFGGYCLPKDTEALCVLARRKGYQPLILKNILDVNRNIKKYINDKICRAVKKDEYIGILGLSFKPNSDDVRNTPAKDIIKLLLKRGYYKIIAYDPAASENFKEQHDIPIEYADCMKEVLKKSDNILILTAWDEFRKNKALRRKNVFDLRYML